MIGNIRLETLEHIKRPGTASQVSGQEVYRKLFCRQTCFTQQLMLQAKKQVAQTHVAQQGKSKAEFFQRSF